MNRVILIGNLTRDPESRVTQSGLAVCNLNIAVNRRVRQGQEGNAPTADFFRVTTFGKTAENCGRFLAKGRKVGIVGSIQNDNFEAADGTKRYSVQMRLRADLVPGRKGPAVTAGIYDPKTKKHVCSCSYPAEKLSYEYAWYTIGTFDPATLSDQAYLFVGDGYLDKSGKRYVPALYLDKLRFAATAEGDANGGRK